jgi:tRNA(adenine34) deaminase
MELALQEAKKGYAKGEVPVGAVIVRGDEVLGRGHNLKETLKDPTAHAEIMAIREAASSLGSWRILNASLYVTLEPCPMCAGAILQARIPSLFIGAKDPKAGACGTVVDLLSDERFNHQVDVMFGLEEDRCAFLLARFFKKLRA